MQKAVTSQSLWWQKAPFQLEGSHFSNGKVVGSNTSAVSVP